MRCKPPRRPGYRTVGVYDGQGEPDQAGLRQAAEVYLTELACFPRRIGPHSITVTKSKVGTIS